MLEIKERFCKRCSHLCHCVEADHEGCKCTGCDCDSGRAEQATYEGDKEKEERE